MHTDSLPQTSEAAMQSLPTSGLQLVSLGSASSPGGRAGQDDRAQAFSFVVTWQGKKYRCTVAAVLDGHHGSVVSEMASSMLPTVLTDAIWQHVAKTDSLDDGIEQGMSDCIMQLDTATFNMWHSQASMTGGTTLLVLLMILETGVVFTCNVGDCKAVLSVKGNAEALSECHNPPVLSEKSRFEEAGISCFMDHIGGSDINVCRTIGTFRGVSC
jgi:serine/threonine protein phosphatase PrpC